MTKTAKKTKAKPMTSKSSKPRKRKQTDRLVRLLKRDGGVTMTVLLKELGCQAHTIRAMISGLRKDGMVVTLVEKGTYQATA